MGSVALHRDCQRGNPLLRLGEPLEGLIDVRLLGVVVDAVAQVLARVAIFAELLLRTAEVQRDLRVLLERPCLQERLVRSLPVFRLCELDSLREPLSSLDRRIRGTSGRRGCPATGRRCRLRRTRRAEGQDDCDDGGCCNLASHDGPLEGAIARASTSYPECELVAGGTAAGGLEQVRTTCAPAPSEESERVRHHGSGLTTERYRALWLHLAVRLAPAGFTASLREGLDRAQRP